VRLAFGVSRPVHVVQAEHAEIQPLGAKGGDAAFQQPLHRIAHIEVHHPPGRTCRGQRPEDLDVVEARDDAASGRVVVEGDARCEDPVEEPLEDRREIEPPLRKDKDHAIGCLQPLYPVGGCRSIIGVGEIAAALRHAQARIEILAIEIEQVDGMAARLQSSTRFTRHVRGKTVFERVSKHEQNMHLLFLIRRLGPKTKASFCPANEAERPFSIEP